MRSQRGRFCINVEIGAATQREFSHSFEVQQRLGWPHIAVCDVSADYRKALELFVNDKSFFWVWSISVVRSNLLPS